MDEIHHTLLEVVVPNLRAQGFLTFRVAMPLAECFIFATWDMLGITSGKTRWDMAHLACAAGCPFMIKLFAGNSGKTLMYLEEERTAMILMACGSGNVAAAKVAFDLFFVNPADVFVWDVNIASLETAACRAGDAETYLWLRTKERPEYRLTPWQLYSMVMAACKSGERRIVELILVRNTIDSQRGADFLHAFDLPRRGFCEFPLTKLCSRGNLGLLKWVWEQHIQPWANEHNYWELEQARPVPCTELGEVRAWCLAAAAGNGHWDVVTWLLQQPNPARATSLESAFSTEAAVMHSFTTACKRGDLNSLERLFHELYPPAMLEFAEFRAKRLLKLRFARCRPAVVKFLSDRINSPAVKHEAMLEMFEEYVAEWKATGESLTPSDYGCVAYVAKWHDTNAYGQILAGLITHAFDELFRCRNFKRIEEVLARHREEIAPIYICKPDTAMYMLVCMCGCAVSVLEDWASLVNLTKERVSGAPLAYEFGIFCKHGYLRNYANVEWMVTRFSLTAAEVDEGLRMLLETGERVSSTCWDVLEKHCHIDRRTYGPDA